VYGTVVYINTNWDRPVLVLYWYWLHRKEIFLWYGYCTVLVYAVLANASLEYPKNHLLFSVGLAVTLIDWHGSGEKETPYFGLFCIRQDMFLLQFCSQMDGIKVYVYASCGRRIGEGVCLFCFNVSNFP
jgi:hypothetical protein